MGRRDNVIGIKNIENAKRALAISALCASVMLLVGCAGTHSDFECDASTSDSCMTMEQANERARAETESPSVKPAVTALPLLVDPAKRAEVKTAVSNNEKREWESFLSLITAIPNAGVSLTQSKLDTVSPRHQRCRLLLCEAASEVLPIRTPASVINVWIAPYVDVDDALHQPGRISLVASHPRWQLPAVIN